MTKTLSRRAFLGALGSGMLLPVVGGRRWTGVRPPIRTITAGLEIAGADDRSGLDAALGFLNRAKHAFIGEGYEIQTTRIATQPLGEYLPRWQAAPSLSALQALDRHASDADVVLSVGPVLTADETAPDLAPWAADLVGATTRLSFSAFIGAPGQGVHHRTARAAAAAISAISRATPGGEGNFRFAATAFCPPGIPFFPAAYHRGERGFSIGLQSPLLLEAAFTGASDLSEARTLMHDQVGAALAPVEALARRIERETGWRYLGVDVSPAPSVQASIGAAVETLTGVPFGAPSTLAACAMITEVLQELPVRRCGYSGLMLPVLEDPVLARRAREERFGVAELLLYSSVCGTGLDVVPLPGDTPVARLAALLADVATLATRYQKPLSARLFPAPGKEAGEEVSFDNPYLVPAAVMRLD